MKIKNKYNNNFSCNRRSSVWVSANAGAGKTHNLIVHLSRLLLGGGLPEKILCLTYTNSAAIEMQNRIFSELGSWTRQNDKDLEASLKSIGEHVPAANKEKALKLSFARQLFARVLETPGGLKILTLHGFCRLVLKKFATEASVNSNFRILDERGSNECIRDALDYCVEMEKTELSNFLRHYNGIDLVLVAEQILKFRHEFKKGFRKEKFYKLLGVADQKIDFETEWKKLFRSLPENVIPCLIKALSNGGEYDLKQAENLRKLRFQSSLEKFETFEKVFLTKGRIRSVRNYPSKRVKESYPEILDIFCVLQQRVLEFRTKLNDSKMIQKNSDLYEFANKFLNFYEKTKLKRGFVDYDDLIFKVSQLLKKENHDWVKFKLDGGVDHILLDEAQDTSPNQWRIILELTKDFFSDTRFIEGKRSLYVVGDFKQSIYSFQGAKPIALQEMEKVFYDKIKPSGNNLLKIDLESSYRSSPIILELVDQIFSSGELVGASTKAQHKAFFSDMAGRIELWPVIEKTKKRKSACWWEKPIGLTSVKEVDQLSSLIVQNVKSILNSNAKFLERDHQGNNRFRSILPADFLILVRNRGTLYQSLIKCLSEAGLQVSSSDRLQIQDSLVIKDIISILKFLNNHTDDLSLAEALRSPLLGFSEEELFQTSFGRKGSLYESLVKNFFHHQAVFILLDLIEFSKINFTYEIVERILIKHSGRKRFIDRLGTNVEEVLDQFLEQILIFEETEIPSLRGFLIWISNNKLSSKKVFSPIAQQIRVSTVHGAKGLESPIVILPDTFNQARQGKNEIFLKYEDIVFFNDNNLDATPAVKLIKDQYKKLSQEEENRLLYVALTRAKNWLIICGAGSQNDSIDVDKSWYAQCRDAFNKLDCSNIETFHETFGSRQVIEHNWSLISSGMRQEKTTKNKNFDFQDIKSQDLFSWLFAPLSEASDIKKIVTPSVVMGNCEEQPRFPISKKSMSDRVTTDKKPFGSVVHALLQALPGVPEERWQMSAKKIATELNLDEIFFDEAFLEVYNILKNPDFNIFFKENIFREFFVTGTLDSVFFKLGKKKPYPIFEGRIDLLYIESPDIYILDFKTDEFIPETEYDIKKAYLAQLEIYASLIEERFPKFKIHIFIMWTKIPKLFKISRIRSCEAIEEIFRDEVLDGTFYA